MRRRALSLLLRVGVLGGALFFLFRGVAWSSVGTTLRSARPEMLVAVVAANALMLVVKSWRLRVLLRGAAGFRPCFLAKLSSSAMNNVVPFRGGDMARLWMLQRHANMSKTGAAAIAIVEALFDLATLAPLALAGGAAVHGQHWAIGAAVGLGVVAAVLLVLSRRMARRAQPEQPRAGAGRARRWLAAFAARIRPGVAALRERGVFSRALVASALGWILEVAMVVLCGRAVGLPVNPLLAGVLLLAINVALAVPSSPAGAGAFEGAAVIALMLAGIAKSPAVAFALLYHLIQIVPVTAVGAVVVWRSGITLDRLPAAVPQPTTSATAKPSQPLTPTV
jgi:uncharacterized protein (TIRG00374 family)